jgi:hypothetical protein
MEESDSSPSTQKTQRFFAFCGNMAAHFVLSLVSAVVLKKLKEMWREFGHVLRDLGLMQAENL